MILIASLFIVGETNQRNNDLVKICNLFAKEVHYLSDEKVAISLMEKNGVPDVLLYVLKSSSLTSVSFLYQFACLPGISHVLLMADMDMDMDVTHSITEMLTLESNHTCSVLKTKNIYFKVIEFLRKKTNSLSNKDIVNRKEIIDVTKRKSFTPNKSDLLNALKYKHFKPYYQPQICASSGQLIGVEALVRWVHPIHGILNPANFFPAIMQHGLLADLEWQIMEQVIAQIHEWTLNGRSIKTSVNVSLLQLIDPCFSDRVQALLSQYDVSPNLLCIELTETEYCPDVQKLLATTSQLRLHGISLSIDDFGTGHSSLLQLMKNPVNELKIDKSFVKNLHEDRYRIAIQASLFIAKKMSLHTVAEGVETEDQILALQEMGCDSFQGFYYAPPLPSAELLNWLLSPTSGRVWGISRIVSSRHDSRSILSGIKVL